MVYKKIVFLFFIMINCLILSHYSCSVDEAAKLIRIKLYKNGHRLTQKYFNKLGDHIIAEFIDCSKNLTDLTIEKIETMLDQAAQEAGATVLTIKSFAFPPMPWVGITSVAVLQESHISVHTWPECGYIAIDIFTCGEHVHAEKALEALQKFFDPENVSIFRVDRGFLDKNKVAIDAG